MKVGVIGSGVVGQVLGAGFISRGHEVKLGTREPGKDTVKAWVAKNGAKASAGTFEETAKFGELVVLATLWDGTLRSGRDRVGALFGATRDGLDLGILPGG